MLRIVADDKYHPPAANDFTFYAHWFDACSNFHYFIRYVILPFVASYGDISMVTRSPGIILIK